MTTPLLYIAGPYIGDVDTNIAEAEKVSIALIRNGWHVFTPHKNTSGYEQYEDDTINHDTWLEMDLNILARCDAIYLMHGWSVSYGATKEMQFAVAHDIPMYSEYDYPAEDFKVVEKI